jgi:DNA-directed RNA polymerase specialized sigma24 family protein
METRIAEAVMHPKTRGAVWNILAGFGLGQDVDDVVADTAESALKASGSFDPGLGHVQGWVLTIAKRRAYDHAKRAGAKGRLQGRLEGESDGPDPALNLVEDDFAQEVVERLAASAESRQILALTEKLVANPDSFRRVAALWMVYQGSVPKASAALGISQEALRDSRREVVRCAHVVRKAVAARSAGDPVTVGTLLGCLPVEGNEDGSWARALSVAVVRAGGFGKVTAASMAEVTGYSLNTCRQYVVEAHWLLQVARTVLEGVETA